MALVLGVAGDESRVVEGRGMAVLLMGQANAPWVGSFCRPIGGRGLSREQVITSWGAAVGFGACEACRDRFWEAAHAAVWEGFVAAMWFVCAAVRNASTGGGEGIRTEGRGGIRGSPGGRCSPWQARVEFVVGNN